MQIAQGQTRQIYKALEGARKEKKACHYLFVLCIILRASSLTHWPSGQTIQYLWTLG